MIQKKTILYMHTLGGKPAYYDGDQIVYGLQSIGRTQLCKSLAELREQQDWSSVYRREHFHDTQNDYGYIRVYLD